MTVNANANANASVANNVVKLMAKASASASAGCPQETPAKSQCSSNPLDFKMGLSDEGLKFGLQQDDLSLKGLLNNELFKLALEKGDNKFNFEMPLGQNGEVAQDCACSKDGSATANAKAFACGDGASASAKASAESGKNPTESKNCEGSNPSTSNSECPPGGDKQAFMQGLKAGVMIGQNMPGLNVCGSQTANAQAAASAGGPGLSGGNLTGLNMNFGPAGMNLGFNMPGTGGAPQTQNCQGGQDPLAQMGLKAQMPIGDGDHLLKLALMAKIVENGQ